MCRKVQEALRFLAPMISDTRRKKIASVVGARTRTVCILLENINDKGNVNAVLRSMEAFGFLDVHQVISTPPKKESRMRTDVGARQWVSIRKWATTAECVQYLKEEQGHKIACAVPNAPLSLPQMDFCQKTVLAFGSEAYGISDSLSKMSDVTFSIPMVGFVQSFNISVSVALTLYSAYCQRVQRLVSWFSSTTSELKLWLILAFLIEFVVSHCYM